MVCCGLHNFVATLYWLQMTKLNNNCIIPFKVGENTFTSFSLFCISAFPQKNN